jgi:hypothetical protein
MRGAWTVCAGLVACFALGACGQAAGNGAATAADAVEDADATIAPVDAAKVPDAPDALAAEVAADGDAAVDADAAETSPPDAQDAADAALACPGGAHCPCATASECDNGICLTDENGSYCAALCVGNGGCTASEACIQTTLGPDTIALCAPRFTSLCSPCVSDSDCRKGVMAGAPNCHDFGDSGYFCTAACAANSPCPDGFACTAGACVPNGGVCTCSNWAVAQSVTTTCAVSNGAGSCQASLKCSAPGPMPACLAATPTSETCNGKDDNCNGLTDDAVTCDDSNDCTGDFCLGGGCIFVPASQCGDNKCVGKCGETPVTCPADCTPGVVDLCATAKCDDANPCTDDGCDPATGCTNLPNSATCSDGNVCTSGDGCLGGLCVASGIVACDDSNPCTSDACAPGSGCVYLPNSVSCSDGSACTIGEKCQGGGCSGASALVCNDGNGCTTDTCDPGVGCTSTNADGATCSDGDGCTAGDSCFNGACNSGGPLDCDDKNVCTNDSCSAGTCVHLANTATCTDANACAIDAHCSGGSCASANTVVCNDGNPCTTDICDPVVGCTAKNADGIGCSDGQFCTTGDTCQGGACIGGGPPNCDDKNACTDDGCQDGACVHLANASTCSDNNACTTGEHCAASLCGDATALVCDDGNPCTTDACDPKTGCTTSDANGSKCSDGDGCTTQDTCSGGICVGGPAPNCDDANVCTVDGCVNNKCAHISSYLTCNDGDACTTGEHCIGSLCAGASAVVCSDGNPCTSDTCESGSGCKFPFDNAGMCTDNNACTVNDACSSGACVGSAMDCSDGNLCTNDSCAGGSCNHLNNAATCNDADLCTLGDVCSGGICAGFANTCNDAIPCTIDACDAATGACSHTPGPASTCDDSQPCTDDSCVPSQGCVHTANSASCSDGNVCTTGEACKNSACQGGTAVVCNDGNACTNDSCDATIGCTTTNNSLPCNDGDPCTTGDVCQNGSCKPTTASDCAPGILTYDRITNTLAKDDLRKVCWHPSGDFALILGGGGIVLRYTVAGKTLTPETTLGKDVRDLDVMPDGSYFLVLGSDASYTRIWKGTVGVSEAVSWSADATMTSGETPVAIAVEPGGASFGVGTNSGSPNYVTHLRRWQNGKFTLTNAVATGYGLWDIMWTGAGTLPALYGNSDVLMTSQGINGGGSQTWIIDSNAISSNWGGGGNGGGAGWRPGGTFGIITGWSSNVVYVYDGAWKSGASPSSFSALKPPSRVP